jgi:sugar phosphate isomerase/epimerase
MRLGFSTLGCPDWTFAEIVATAKDMGFSSIEIRGIKNELYAPRIPEFSRENAATTKEKLKNAKLNISCLTSQCYLQKGQKYLDEAKDYIETARAMKIPFIRVLGDSSPEPSEVDCDLVFSLLKSLDEYAKNSGVMPLIETNGVYANSLLLKEMFQSGNFKNTGILWDINHPYVYYKETPSYTYSNIGEYVKHIHIKDSVVEGDKVKYKMVGSGELPIAECIDVAKNSGFDGVYSLEWVKRWNNELEDPAVAFVHYKYFMDSLKKN